LFFNKGMVGIDDFIHVKIPNPIIIAIIFNFDTFWFSLPRLIFIDSLVFIFIFVSLACLLLYVF
jgi:dolichyl-phosphate-mannose--protein O-mannosyl transferase